MVIFEGRDAAGKGGVIKRITQRLNPRVCRVAALPAPNERERTQWYFQRYVSHLPAGGEMVLFDRSWYNRAGVERVMGFCTEGECEEFLRTVPEFEKMLVRSGIKLIKYWFSITDDEQHFRFMMRIHDPLKQWKLSPMDLESRRRWEDYTRAKEVMLERTHIPEAPWWIVDAVDKKKARLNCIEHLLSQVPYQEIKRPPIDPATPHAPSRLSPASYTEGDVCAGDLLVLHSGCQLGAAPAAPRRDRSCDSFRRLQRPWRCGRRCQIPMIRAPFLAKSYGLDAVWIEEAANPTHRARSACPKPTYLGYQSHALIPEAFGPLEVKPSPTRLSPHVGRLCFMIPFGVACRPRRLRTGAALFPQFDQFRGHSHIVGVAKYVLQLF